MYTGTKEEMKALAGAYPCLPRLQYLYSDAYTPLQIVRKAKAVSQHVFILESMENSNARGRYTFIGYTPKLRISCLDGTIEASFPLSPEEQKEGPNALVRKIIAKYRFPQLPGLPPFLGGFAGYYSFEYIQYAEPSLVFTGKNDAAFYDMDLMFFDKLIIFDHLEQKLILSVLVQTDDLDQNYERAGQELEEMAAWIKTGQEAAEEPLRLLTPPAARYTQAEYEHMVERGKSYIKEGDCFQVVLSNPITAAAEGSLLDTYRVLRTSNPSPYMFYFSGTDIEIAGSSPETLVRVCQDTVYTYPLAGTRRRGASEKEDKALEKELLRDEKERAEHVMLVDLGRNDIGKVARFGSVEVERYMYVERYSRVMHLASAVKGRLAPGKDSLDALAAGAPKIRACQIIDELEGHRRGVYGGALGYIDGSGNLDMCIAIRTAFKKNGVVYVQSGAGIVADSVPAAEYQECRNKASAVLDAIQLAEGGLE